MSNKDYTDNIISNECSYIHNYVASYSVVQNSEKLKIFEAYVKYCELNLEAPWMKVPLILAASLVNAPQHIAVMNILLKQNANPNHLATDNKGPLLVAFEYGNKAAFDLLCQHGADISKQGGIATFLRPFLDTTWGLHEKIDFNAMANCTSECSAGDYINALHMCSIMPEKFTSKCLNSFIAVPACIDQINKLDDNNETFLMKHIRNNINTAESATELASQHCYGVDMNLQDNNGNTAMHFLLNKNPFLNADHIRFEMKLYHPEPYTVLFDQISHQCTFDPFISNEEDISPISLCKDLFDPSMVMEHPGGYWFEVPFQYSVNDCYKLAHGLDNFEERLANIAELYNIQLEL
jgi:hypothetical protein